MSNQETRLWVEAPELASSLQTLALTLIRWLVVLLTRLALIIESEELVQPSDNLKDEGTNMEMAEEITEQDQETENNVFLVTKEEFSSEDQQTHANSPEFSTFEAGPLSRSRQDTLQSTDSGFADLAAELVQCGKDERTGLEVLSLEEVSWHCGEEDAWLVLYDRVYDVTEYLATGRGHPGGTEVILEYCGYDATLAFRGVGHTQAAARILEKCCIGILPENERLNFSSDI